MVSEELLKKKKKSQAFLSSTWKYWSNKKDQARLKP